MGLAFHEKLYTYGLWASYVIFGLTTLGLWSTGTEVLPKLEFLLTIYIALFLIYNFNPYKKQKPLSGFGRGIAFSAGILILLTKGVKKYLTELENKELTGFLDILHESKIGQVETEVAEVAELGELAEL